METGVIETLTIENLECRRGGRVLFSNLNFTLSKGQALILRGPNGAGKTTLLRTIAGFMQPAAGQIVATLSSTSGVTKDRTEHLHYLGHASGVKARLSVMENMQFWQRYYEADASMGDEALEDALDVFGLLPLADFRAAHLSAGLGRRLGLARLLAAARPLWILDEPTTSLDAASIAILEKLITGHLSEGGLALISTHGDLRLPQADTLHIPSGMREALAA